MTSRSIEIIDLTGSDTCAPSSMPASMSRKSSIITGVLPRPPTSAKSSTITHNSVSNGVNVSINTRRQQATQASYEDRKVLEEGELVGSKNRSNLEQHPDDSCRPRKKRRRSPSPLFYFDTLPNRPETSSASASGSREQLTRSAHATPDDEPERGPENTQQSVEPAEGNIALLLPDHVTLESKPSINGVPVIKEASTLIGAEEEEFIHYADLDESRNIGLRYYDEPKTENTRRSHYICSHCGAEGDHKSANCPVVICLTCGAHNEHSTRGCPISKTCFNCAMKGHVSKDCPNRNATRRLKERNAYNDCDRCGSELHNTRECPTLWRMYEYIDDSERDSVIRLRRLKQDLPIGQGGEGYVGDDLWCYNCGKDGHLGDDCEETRLPDHPREPSAFSSYNVLSGPFADISSKPSHRTFRREWEMEGNFDDGHGFNGLSDVGKRGRAKEREKMRRQEKERRVSDDEDWFGSRLKSSAETGRGQREQKSSQKRKTHKEDDRRDSMKAKLESPGDRLLARISSRQELQRNDDRHQKRDADKPRLHESRRDRRDRERRSVRAPDRDGRSSEPKRGQQYYGGYGR